jgi:hypothetical protein
MTDAILPRLPDLVGAAAQKLIEERPAARPHIVAGRWGDLLAQQKAEAALALKRLASEVQAARVGQAEGRALYDLLVSEFDAIITPEPSKAVGTILLDRNYGDGTVTMPGGIIPKGTRFRKVADASTSPPVRGADYVSVTPVFVEPAPGNYTQSISVRIEAAQAGTAANAQPWEETCFALADALFDSDIAVNEGAAAGGSDGFSTARLRSLARALSLGQYGPVSLALVAGALSTPGVTRVAACEHPNRWKHTGQQADAQHQFPRDRRHPQDHQPLRRAAHDSPSFRLSQSKRIITIEFGTGPVPSSALMAT